MAAVFGQRAHQVGAERHGALQQRDDGPAVVDLRGEAFGELIDPRSDLFGSEKYAQAPQLLEKRKPSIGPSSLVVAAGASLWPSSG